MLLTSHFYSISTTFSLSSSAPGSRYRIIKEYNIEAVTVYNSTERANSMESLPIAPTAGVQQSPHEFFKSLSLWVHAEARLLSCFDDNCKHAISPNGSHPTNHLRDKHKIPLSRRKGLSEILATLNLKNPEQAAPLNSLL